MRERIDPRDYRFETTEPPGHSYTTSYLVRGADITPERQLRLDGIARYLQDIAVDNLKDATFAESDPDWLVRRTIIDVIEPVFWPDRLTLTRWCEATSNRWCNMRITLRGEETGTPDDPRPLGHIETQAFWIRFNIETLMPARFSDEGYAYLSKGVTDTRLKWFPLNDNTTPEDVVEVPYRLRHTDFDLYQHVNNAAYWSIAEDFLQGSELLKNPHRGIVEYLTAIPLGMSLKVFGRKSDDSAQLWLHRVDADGNVEPKAAATIAIMPLPSDPAPADSE